MRFAPNGGAVPGDRIVGILTPGEGITIYPIQSPALKDFEDTPERWLDVRWDVEERTPQRFPGAHRAADRERARHAGADRAGDRRARRQHRQHPHDPAVARTSPAARSISRSTTSSISTAIIAQLRAKTVVAKAERVNGVSCVDAVHGRVDQRGADLLISASASTSTTSRPSATRAAGGIPIRCARRKLAIAAGADGITAHLREDRRHIRDDDIARLKAEIAKPLNFEMAATDEMVAIALKTRPHAACLVPERREERTTEGGLDVAGQHDALAPAVARAARGRHPGLAVHRRRAARRSRRRSRSARR